MNFLSDLAEVLKNSNTAMAGNFLRTHAKEIAALVEAAEGVDRFMVSNHSSFTRLSEALAALNKEKNT